MHFSILELRLTKNSYMLGINGMENADINLQMYRNRTHVAGNGNGFHGPGLEIRITCKNIFY